MGDDPIEVGQERLLAAQLRLAFGAAGIQVWDWIWLGGRWAWTGVSELAFPGVVRGQGLEDYYVLVHEEDRRRVRETVEASLERGEGDFSFTHRLDDERWFQIVGVLIVAEGKPKRLVGVMRDVTLDKAAEEEKQKFRERAEQAQRLESLGVLAGGIAHDFNNLLVSVLGNAELALKEIGRGHPSARNLDAIGNAAQRASELCQQLLAYSGKGRFVVEAVSLTELVRDMADLLEISVSKRAALQLDLDPGAPAVEVDVVQMRQVVMNLITNAAEAVEGGGVITLRVGAHDYDQAYLRATFFEEGLEAGRYVQLEVTDNGRGMSEQAQARIFDPFFTTKFTGRGLGLAAVLGIVKGHGGAIRVDSELGKGTTFRVILPASDTASSVEEITGDLGPEPLRGHVLLIDDQPDVLLVGKEMLMALGLEVTTAEGGALGVEKYAERRADVVMLDMTMPEVDGYETFRRLRDLDPEVQVVLSSGYSEQDATHRFMGRGLKGFIQKPYRMSVLEKLLRSVLEGDASS